MKASVAIGLAGLALTGCVEAEEADERESEAPEAESEAASGGGLVPDAAAGPDGVAVVSEGGDGGFDPACRIEADKVAGIAVPDTLGDFVSAFPAGTMLSFYPHYMVDFGKLCLRAGGEDALCADFESYDVESYSPDIEVVGLSVYAPQCRTAEGIGPGSPVSAAVQAYGAPTFGFNYDNEGREYVRFADQPDGYGFRARSGTAEADASAPGRPNGAYAGDYQGVEGDGGYFETDAYHPDGEIWEVLLSVPLETRE